LSCHVNTYHSWVSYQLTQWPSCWTFWFRWQRLNSWNRHAFTCWLNITQITFSSINIRLSIHVDMSSLTLSYYTKHTKRYVIFFTAIVLSTHSMFLPASELTRSVKLYNSCQINDAILVKLRCFLNRIINIHWGNCFFYLVVCHLI